MPMAVSFALGIFLAGSGRDPHLLAGRASGVRGSLFVAGLFTLRAGWERASLLLALLGFLAAGASSGCLFQISFPA